MALNFSYILQLDSSVGLCPLLPARRLIYHTYSYLADVSRCCTVGVPALFFPWLPPKYVTPSFLCRTQQSPIIMIILILTQSLFLLQIVTFRSVVILRPVAVANKRLWAPTNSSSICPSSHLSPTITTATLTKSTSCARSHSWALSAKPSRR